MSPSCRHIVKEKVDHFGDGYNATYPKVITKLDHVQSARSYGDFLYLSAVDAEGQKIEVQIGKRGSSGKKAQKLGQNPKYVGMSTNITGTRLAWEQTVDTKPFEGIWVSGKGKANVHNRQTIDLKNPRINLDRIPVCKK